MKTLKKSALAVAFTAAAATAVFADPLSDLLAKGDGGACYGRMYDEAHLAKNKQQATRSVRLSLMEYEEIEGTAIRIQFVTKSGQFFVAGSCAWADPANRDIQDKPLIEAFKAKGGLDCHATTSEDGSSAEEGGDFPVDLRDGRSIVLYMPDAIAGWPSFDLSNPADFFSFGTEDRIFRLDKTDPALCSELDEKLP